MGGGIGMGKTCKLKDVSFQCMTKFTTNKKKKEKKKENGICLTQSMDRIADTQTVITQTQQICRRNNGCPEHPLIKCFK